MKKVLLLLAVMLFVWCANKATISCPSCVINGADGSTTYTCTDCKVEAEVSDDFISLPTLGGRE